MKIKKAFLLCLIVGFGFIISGCGYLGIKKEYNLYMPERDQAIQLENEILHAFQTQFIQEESDKKAEDNAAQLIAKYDTVIERLKSIELTTSEWKNIQKKDIEAAEMGKKSLEYHLEYSQTGVDEVLNQALEAADKYILYSEKTEKDLSELAKRYPMHFE